MQNEGVFRTSGQQNPVQITLFCVPGFSMIALASFIEPLRLANFLTNRQLYQWRVVSLDGTPTVPSSGVSVGADCAISDCPNPSNIVVVGGLATHAFSDASVTNWLRHSARKGVYIGGLCTASHVLARAGLLNGYRCTIHWSGMDSIMEDFPELDLKLELFEIDRDRFTCAGGVAALDMCLHDIAKRHSPTLAAAVSDQMMHERIRAGNDNQRLPLQTRLRISHPKLIKAIAEMEQNTEMALDRTEIAARVNLSRRQLERLFRRYLNTSPARFYLRLRLNRARMLLNQTTLPVTEIAFACGFTSASHFSKCYRELFLQTPRSERALDMGEVSPLILRQ
ncbi:MAG: GlxA family transcriptional regulator [Pseudomonadota bacterium]